MTLLKELSMRRKHPFKTPFQEKKKKNLEQDQAHMV